ncbi:MAG: bifunctional nicotinamidase/pyrazinamidase [Acidobacteria bacterium]|nr:bifunctional nicotinamidase/pyrazinamidase [Acidobacteriota bacterium]
MNRLFQQSALILVDIQNDFCPGGALAVNDGDAVVEVVNRLMRLFPVVVATLDWHPFNHCSFRQYGGMWPPHCVQHSNGAALHRALQQTRIDDYFRKAYTPADDSYSGFDGRNEAGDSLHPYLQKKGIEKVFIAGLATDYCVKVTALAALQNGYEVVVIGDAIRAVEVQEGDGERAIGEVLKRGAQVIHSDELLRQARAASTTGA